MIDKKAFQEFMIAGPEIARILQEFENHPRKKKSQQGWVQVPDGEYTYTHFVA